MERIGAPWWIRLAINLGAVLGVGSVILVMLLGQSRVFYSMSRDGLLGPWAGRVHPRFRTPYLSTIYTGIAVCFATGLLPLQLLGTWVNIGTLLAFVLVCAGVWILRYTRPDLERPFRAPRSEEHTSELQSQSNLVCRLLLEKKKQDIHQTPQGRPGQPNTHRPRSRSLAFLVLPRYSPTIMAAAPALCLLPAARTPACDIPIE